MAFEGLYPGAVDAASTAQHSADAAIRAVEEVVSRTLSIVASATAGAGTAGKAIVQSAVDTATNLASQARGVATQMGMAVLNGLGQVRDVVASLFSRAASFAVGAGSAVVGAVQSLFDTLAETISGAARNAQAGLNNGALESGVARAVTTIFNGVATALQTIVGQIQAAAGAAWSAIRPLITSALEAVGAVLEDILVPLVEAGAALAETIAAAVAEAAAAAAASIAEILAPLLIAALAAIGPFIARVMNNVYVVLSSAIAVAQQAVLALPGLVSQLWTFISQGVVGLISMVRTGLSTVAGVVQSAWTTLTTWAQTAWSFATRAGSFIVSSIGSIVSAVASVAKTALTFGLAVGQIVGAGSLIAVFAGAVWKSVEAATAFAQSARDLSGVTGFSLGKSAGLLDRLGIQGIGAQSVQGVYQNQSPFAADLKARAFGLSGGPSSAGFLESFSQRFQSLQNSGAIGNAIAQSMVKTLGLNAEFVRAAQTSPATQHANTAYQRQIDSNLGLTPNALARYAEEIPAMLQRISYGASKALQTLASIALPLVEQIGNFATKFIGDNAGNIRDFLGNAARTMFVKISPAFVGGIDTIIQIVAAGVTNLVTWGLWFQTTFPAILTNLAQVTADVLRSWSAAFDQWATSARQVVAQGIAGIGLTLATWIYKIGDWVATQIESFDDGLRAISKNAALQSVVTAIATAIDATINIFSGAGKAYQHIVADFQNFVLKYASGLAPHIGITAQTAATATQNANAPSVTSNLAGGVPTFFRTTLPTIADKGDDFARNARKRALDAATDVYARMSDFASNVDDVAGRAQGGVTRALNGTADFAQSHKNDGQAFANFVRPGVELLSNIQPAIKDFASASQAYKQSLGSESERNARYDEMIAEQKRGNDIAERQARGIEAMRENLQRNGSLGGGFDAVAGYVLSSYAAQRAAAIESQM